MAKNIKWWETADAPKHGRKPSMVWNTLGIMGGIVTLLLLLWLGISSLEPKNTRKTGVVEEVLLVTEISAPKKTTTPKQVTPERREEVSSLSSEMVIRESSSVEEEEAINSLVAWLTKDAKQVSLASGVSVSLQIGSVPRTANLTWLTPDGEACQAFLTGGGSKGLGLPRVKSSCELNFLPELWETIKESYR